MAKQDLLDKIMVPGDGTGTGAPPVGPVPAAAPKPPMPPAPAADTDAVISEVTGLLQTAMDKLKTIAPKKPAMVGPKPPVRPPLGLKGGGF
jgi:hypothetical protein